MQNIKPIVKNKKEMDDILQFAKEVDRQKDNSEIENLINFKLNFLDIIQSAIQNQPTVKPTNLVKDIKKEKLTNLEHKTIDKLTISIKSLENKISTLEKKFDGFTEQLINRIADIEKVICIEDDGDIIKIKDYSYEEARSIIEKYLQENDRSIYPSEFMIKFGIELKLCHQIFSDLLSEGKIE